MRLSVQVAVAVFLISLPAICRAAVIDFEGLAIGIRGSVVSGEFVVSSQSAFHVGGPGYCTPNCAENGTLTLLTQTGELPLILRHGDNLPFHATSFDHGEKWVGSTYSTSIVVDALRVDGTRVTVSFPVDGVNDGGGPTVDFQRAILPASFRNLTQLSFTSVQPGVHNPGYLLDNIAVTPVPEPTSAISVAVGAAAFALGYRRSKRPRR